MLSTMMSMPLTITALMQFVDRVHGKSEIVSVTHDSLNHRCTYSQAFKRTRQLANALQALGAQPDDRIGTLAFNDYRHFELYYAISCSGMVCHTVNPRLFPEQLEYIVNHAQDRFLFVDPMFVPLIELLAPKLTYVESIIVLCSQDDLPSSHLENLYAYETLIGQQPSQFDWPELDENQASSLCYTSGTTGNPKGVMYSHRSTILHAYASALPDVFGLSSREVVMPVVPMFHVNSWGLVYSAPMVGASLVLPGPKMGDGKSLCNLINDHEVTLTAGVPTVWLALLNYLEHSGDRVSSLKRLTIGGSACPQMIFEGFERLGIEVNQAWGMTEMSPLGTYNRPQPWEFNLPDDEYLSNRLCQGRPIFGVDIKIVDDQGNELPWNGEQAGAVRVRGPWVTAQYFKQSPNLDSDGWFETGDVACISPDGMMRITDRVKDVIKSGGEWISSIDLENCALNHPDVAEAAVIGIAHIKWAERPLLLVVKRDGAQCSRTDILKTFEGKVANWSIPDAVEFVDELPHTATGKLSKKDLREAYANYQWPQPEVV